MNPPLIKAQRSAGAETDKPRRIVHQIDRRWLKAFTAAVGDVRPRFFAPVENCDLIAHPVFPVCLEWPLVSDGPPMLEMDAQTRRRALHAAHEIVLHRQIRADDLLTTTAELRSVRQKGAAIHVAVSFETCGRAEDKVVSSIMHLVYRDARLDGDPFNEHCTPPGSLDVPLDRRIATFHVDRTNAVIYSECAHIWNPIHTEDAAAAAAGLRAPVLHGTETLARTVSAILDYLSPGGWEAVSMLSCRFTDMVFPGASLEVLASDLIREANHAGIAFAVRETSGPFVIANGYLRLMCR